jgi:mono/diheme cytochrome c family protein
MLLAAATTQRAIGWVIFALAIIGFVVYILFNVRSGKPEVASEIELAPNRKPYYPDEELESKKLERSLLFALGMLALIAVGLPFYWLREPARQTNAEDGFNSRSTSRGAELYVAQCQQCHGPGGAGGVREVTLTDPQGDFLATVSWKAPSLTAVLTRFDEDEVLQVLNHGRNGVMPAFGAPGGGPFTTQQLDDLIHYLRSIQLAGDALEEDVMKGVRDGLRLELLAEGSDLALRQAQIDAMEDADAKAGAQERLDAAVEEAIDERLEEISDPGSREFGSVYGRLLFNNTAASGAYSCARCHTEGWSYDATEVLDADGEPLQQSYLDGGGFMAPSLRDGVTVRKFTPEQHVEFIGIGSEDGSPYLPGVASMGSGQMPGFGPRTDQDLNVTYGAILSEEQIAAVVAYERSL